MSVQRKGRQCAAREVGGHPFDLVGMDIRSGVFDGGREIENDFIIRCWLPRIGHRFTNLEGEIEFRTREALGRIFQADTRSANHERLHRFFEKGDGMRGDVNDIRSSRVEDVFPLSR